MRQTAGSLKRSTMLAARLPEPGELEKLTNPTSVAPIRLQKAIRAINGLEPWDPTWDELTYASVLARCIVV